MKQNKLMMMGLLATVLLCATVQAEVVYFNYTGSPVEAVAHATTNTGAWVTSYLTLTTSGAENGLETDAIHLGAFAYGSTFAGVSATADLSYNNHLTWLIGLGDTVDSLSSWGTGEEGASIAYASSPTYSYNSSGNQYVGFRIDQGGGNYNYGWAEIYGIAIADKPNNSADAVIGVNKMAFNNTMNEGIAVGVVPEPATALSLMLGGLLITGYRRISKAYGRI